MSPMLLALIGSVSALVLFSIFDNDDDDQPIAATNEDGGAGADRLVGYADTAQTSQVGDFVPSQDELPINLNPAACTAPDGSSATGDVSVVTLGRETRIQVDGVDVTIIEASAPLAVGPEMGDPDLEDICHVDLEGNEVSRSALDVIVDRHEVFTVCPAHPSKARGLRRSGSAVKIAPCKIPPGLHILTRHG